VEKGPVNSRNVDWATLLIFILFFIFGASAAYLDWDLSPILDKVGLLILTIALVSSAFAAGLKGKVAGVIVAIAGSSLGGLLLLHLGTPPIGAALVTSGVSSLGVLSSVFFGNKQQNL